MGGPIRHLVTTGIEPGCATTQVVASSACICPPPPPRKRPARPSSESGSLQSSSAGVRSRELVLLGSLHVELSSRRRGNHPPLQQPAPPPVPVDRVEVSSVLPQPQKVTRRIHTHLQQSAPPPVLEQVDGRSRPVFEGIGGRPPIPGFEPPPSRQTPGALPLERPPSERHWILAQGTTTQANTPTTHAGASAPPSLPTLCMAVC